MTGGSPKPFECNCRPPAGEGGGKYVVLLRHGNQSSVIGDEGEGQLNCVAKSP